MRNEQWKAIPGYEGAYEVSNMGNVRNSKTLRILKPSINHDGYRQVILYSNGRRSNKRVGRLVAEAFLPNPAGLPEVNHINGNKEDDNVNNLEWVTRSDNMRHAFSTGLKHPSGGSNKRKVAQILGDEIIAIYNSLHEAADAIGVSGGYKNICTCCKGRYKTAYGYKWQYVD